MYEFKLPDVGEGLHEAEISRWLVKVGDVVAQDQIILEIQTDKAVVEIPAPVAGGITKILVQEGQMATVGDLLVVIQPANAEAAPPKAAQPTIAAVSNTPKPGIAGPGERILATPMVRKKALELGVDLSTIKGSGPAGRIMLDDLATQTEKATPSIEESSATTAEPVVTPTNQKVLAAPAVRKLAREKGIDLSQVPGSGDKGRITLPDLEQFAAQQAAAPARKMAEPRPASTMMAQEEITRPEPLRGLRRRIAQRMEQAWQVPQVTTFEEVDASNLVALREQLRPVAEAQGGRLTFLPLIAKALLETLKAFPDFNASLDMAREEILYHEFYHLGIAAAIPDGLVVPVIRHADQMNILELSREINELGELAQSRKLEPQRLSGSTFTISNFGSFGTGVGTPIINPPEVAILGMGRIEKRPVVIDDALAIRPILPLALSFDHRLIDGAGSGAFMKHLRQLLETPQTLLLALR
ncbi:MAG: 2-oxo acid dehydrogenase subunit E2 [Chloroflexota bacterium]